MLNNVFSRCDHSLFRDDIPAKKVIEIINLTMDGYAQQKMKELNSQNIGESIMVNYETYLAETKEYLDILRKIFYK